MNIFFMNNEFWYSMNMTIIQPLFGTGIFYERYIEEQNDLPSILYKASNTHSSKTSKNGQFNNHDMCLNLASSVCKFYQQKISSSGVTLLVNIKLKKIIFQIFLHTIIFYVTLDQYMFRKNYFAASILQYFTYLFNLQSIPKKDIVILNIDMHSFVNE